MVNNRWKNKNWNSDFFRSSKKNTETNDEAPVLLITGPSGSGKSLVCESLATRLNLHIMKVETM